MVKKSERPPVIEDPGLGGERAFAQERDRPLVEEDELARVDSDLEVRGRRYRIGVHDGFVGIWELRSGEQVGTFMEDAFSAAWARYLELEQSRSLNGFMLRTREFLAHRWYAIVVLVLGALTVVYLRTEDPALSPTGAGVGAREAPQAVRPIADLGSSLAGTLDPALADAPARSAEEGHGREQQKKDRAAGKEGPAGGADNATASSPSGDTSGASASGGTSGGSSSGTAGNSTGGDGGGGGAEEPPPPPEEEPPDIPEDPAPPEP